MQHVDLATSGKQSGQKPALGARLERDGVGSPYGVGVVGSAKDDPLRKAVHPWWIAPLHDPGLDRLEARCLEQPYKASLLEQKLRTRWPLECKQGLRAEVREALVSPCEVIAAIA